MTTGVDTAPATAAVIGAGAAGLCAAKHLRALGLEVTIYELGSRVGGLWVYENDNGRSPAYQSLHINSEAAATGYRDFPLPSRPLFPSHEQLAAYLEAYAEKFGLIGLIRFGSEVTAVEPLEAADGARWRVRLADGLVSEVDVVVVAAGHQAVPAHPSFEGSYDGEYLHAHSYRVPEPFRGRRVLVIGVGNSALDIAADICTVTASTTISSRSPVLIMPRMLLGVPLARVLAKVERPWVPWPVARRVRELITRVVHGRMEQWGFTTPTERTHPASHPSIFGHMAWERVTVKPGIGSWKGHQVTFTDGTVADYDAVIAATGYEIDVPFLSADVSPVVERRVELYRRIASPRWPHLYFIGYFNVGGGGNIRMMDYQCGWMDAVVGGRIALPSAEAMRAEIGRERESIRRRYPGSPRYGLELDPREYGAGLREDLAAASEAAVEPERASPSPVA